MTRLTLSLLENALSFLAEGLVRADAAQADPGQWKFAILGLVQAIELATKERLRREHALLVYADVDNPKLTVSLEKALARLGRIATVELTGDDVKNIQLAASIRNSITHHEVDVSVEQVQVVFATLLGFITEFSRRQLQVERAVGWAKQSVPTRTNERCRTSCTAAEFITRNCVGTALRPWPTLQDSRLV